MMVMMMMNNDDDYGGEGDGDGDDDDEDDYGGDVAHCCAIFLGHLSMKIYLYIDDRQIQISKRDHLVGQSTSGDDDENLYTPPLAPTRQTLGSSREVAKDPANTFPVSIVIINVIVQIVVIFISYYCIQLAPSKCKSSSSLQTSKKLRV